MVEEDRHCKRPLAGNQIAPMLASLLALIDRSKVFPHPAIMKRTLALLGALFCSVSATGRDVELENEFDFLAYSPYQADAPSPESFLNYRLGSLHTHHFRVQDYFETLAQALPDRVQLQTYGESYEKKDLFLAVISSPSNLARVEEIRSQNLRLADPRQTDRATAEALIKTLPIVVWLDYGNDGNETANVEAAMQVAYQIAAGESESMQTIRDQAIVIIEPDHNPESHDRHVAWYNAFGIGDSDPKSMEHHAPWGMSTNNNHYQIDLNRDAWPLTQRENQAIASEILRWRPQVFIDHHGQTENYFFAPPAKPINPSLPDSHYRWYEVLGRGTAEAFDRNGWQYFVRDVFDIYYPGYWDSWPALHGALALTYETDGGGSRGLAWRKQDGSIVTFRDGIAHHFVASIATVETAVGNRAGIMSDFFAFFANAYQAGLTGDPTRAYLLNPDDDPRLCASLVGTLLRHGLEVGRLSESFSLEVRSLSEGSWRQLEFPPGSYLIDLAQPDKRMVETLFEPDPALDPDFAADQLAIWSRNARRGDGDNKERQGFYDLTSWSLPLAFGVDGYAASEIPSVPVQPVTASKEFLGGSDSWSDEIPDTLSGFGGVVSKIAGVDSGLDSQARDQPAGSVYLFSPLTEGSMRLVAQLLDKDYSVAVSTQPLMAGAVAFPRGSFVVRTASNPDRLHQDLPAFARDAGVEVVASDTSFPARGQTGPGSHPVRGLRKPRIAMIADEGVSITDYGAAWFHLEKRLAYPFSPIRIRQLLGADLDKLDVIILPEGSSAIYERAFGSRGIEKLTAWIERGGSLVAWGSGALRWLQDSEILATRAIGEETGTNEHSPAETSSTLAEIDRLSQKTTIRPPGISPSANPDAMQPIPGAVARAKVDLTHWLTIGSTESYLPVPIQGKSLLQLSALGQNPIIFDKGSDLRVGGFFWPGNSERWLANSAYVVIEPHGRGQVIAFTQDPNHRLAWRATSRFFSNALLLGPTLGTRTTGGL